MTNPQMSGQTWYRNYKQFAVSIHDNCMEKIKSCTEILEQHTATNQIDPKDHHQIVNNLMFFLCIYCTDRRVFEFFFRTFYDTIELYYYYYETDLCFLGILLQRPEKPIYLIKIFMNQFADHNRDWNWNEYMVWFQGTDGFNCLQTAIQRYDYRYGVSNQETIEYMINVKKMDVTRIAETECMLCIALTNKKSDIHLIKYLLNKIKLSDPILDQESMYPKYLKIATGTFRCIEKKSDLLNYREILGLLISLMSVQQIEGFDTKLLIEGYCCKIFQKIKYAKHLILSIKEKEKLNIVLRKIISSGDYRKSKIIKMIRSVDLRLLNEEHARYAQIPYINLGYDEFVKHVQENKNKNNCTYMGHYFTQKMTEIHQPIDQRLLAVDQIDNSCIPVLLFRYNGVPYYGNKKLFDLMDFFKDNDSVNNGDAEIEGKVPKYLINLYLNQTLSGHIDLSQIDPSDIFEFIRFIDQYPSQVFAVNLIEQHLVQYITINSMSHGIPPDILDTFRRYDCKYIVLYCMGSNDPVRFSDYEGLQYSESESEPEPEQEPEPDPEQEPVIE